MVKMERIESDYLRRVVWARVCVSFEAGKTPPEWTASHTITNECRERWREIVPDWQGWELESIDDKRITIAECGAHYLEGAFCLIEEEAE